MLITLTYFSFVSLVFSCSDCFSKCSSKDLNFCLISCNCPLFAPDLVRGGSFQGNSGLIFVPNLNRVESEWVASKLSCDLICSHTCSLNYLDFNLESCVKSCGCGVLLSKNLVKDDFKEKCESICRGSPAVCALDCCSHFAGPPDTWYFWLIIPSVSLIFLAAWFIIYKKKEDEYILM